MNENNAQNQQRKNWFARHKIMTGIMVVIIFLIVLGMIGGSGDQSGSSTSTQKTSSGGSEAETTTATAPAATVAKIGEPVTDGDLTFTVTGVTTKQTLGNTFTQRDAQGTFHVVMLKIENKGKETKTTDSSMFKIVDSQGREFERSIDGQTAVGLSQGKVDLFLQQIQPGLSVTGDIVFDLPADATGTQLIVKGSLFSKGAKILLEQ
ncbi:MAG: DUF4352 domain-containing protein [Candidatus Andersenbacteria bacterium]|nr:DUF4352 domain-containing protein [Candidatus Andersenbacteria bacterium]